MCVSLTHRVRLFLPASSGYTHQARMPGRARILGCWVPQGRPNLPAPGGFPAPLLSPSNPRQGPHPGGDPPSARALTLGSESLGAAGCAEPREFVTTGPAAVPAAIPPSSLCPSRQGQAAQGSRRNTRERCCLLLASPERITVYRTPTACRDGEAAGGGAMEGVSPARCTRLPTV